ncbi:hypothetical protein P153DRAFT_361835 [Dothidotthia symphoricarpi CBS 119687]|uniref:Uncharacterized protein n=1 Tax=Dothidotthia symphoricarpi CBS 119687 TaxID=1392245 RepID=A0A6A5ZVU1_9PLEO|nr:uncharacterized protein P153DRAFT_361835 [Dothidotthia symphoricarpi CBS 119687]KAF2123710.1 hypothetical protein P153DRAFT_361835 [Dothidotthia symphoricarpi CBS 119687]
MSTFTKHPDTIKYPLPRTNSFQNFNSPSPTAMIGITARMVAITAFVLALQLHSSFLEHYLNFVTESYKFFSLNLLQRLQASNLVGEICQTISHIVPSSVMDELESLANVAQNTMVHVSLVVRMSLYTATRTYNALHLYLSPLIADIVFGNLSVLAISVLLRCLVCTTLGIFHCLQAMGYTLGRVVQILMLPFRLGDKLLTKVCGITSGREEVSR